MKLHGIKIILVQGSTEWKNIVTGCRSMFSQTCEKGMYEINILVFTAVRKQFAVYIIEGIPAHMRYLVDVFLSRFRDKAFHLFIKYSKAPCISLLGMCAHELEPQADAQHRLLQRHD